MGMYKIVFNHHASPSSGVFLFVWVVVDLDHDE